jgi:hypothetical protein
MMAPYKGLPRKPMRMQMRKPKIRKPKYRVRNEENIALPTNYNMGNGRNHSNRYGSKAGQSSAVGNIRKLK